MSFIYIVTLYGSVGKDAEPVSPSCLLPFQMNWYSIFFYNHPALGEHGDLYFHPPVILSAFWTIGAIGKGIQGNRYSLTHSLYDKAGGIDLPVFDEIAYGHGAFV